MSIFNATLSNRSIITQSVQREQLREPCFFSNTMSVSVQCVFSCATRIIVYSIGYNVECNTSYCVQHGLSCRVQHDLFIATRAILCNMRYPVQHELSCATLAILYNMRYIGQHELSSITSAILCNIAILCNMGYTVQHEVSCAT